MLCPRCGSEGVALLAKAPVDDAWEVYLCDVCFYSYRSTEPEARRERRLYDERFRIDPAAISGLDQIPPVPKLRKV